MDRAMSADVTASIANDAAKLPSGPAIVVDDFHAVDLLRPHDIAREDHQLGTSVVRQILYQQRRSSTAGWQELLRSGLRLVTASTTVLRDSTRPGPASGSQGAAARPCPHHAV
jgi:hypothetical protein